MKKLLIFLIVLGCLGGGGYWYLQSSSQNSTAFRTAKAERRKFVAGVTATGTVQPEDIVDVGAQVSGRVERFGVDPRYQPPAGAALVLGIAELAQYKAIDYNSPVEEGTVLAQLDAALFQTRVAAAQADLAQAEADLAHKHATLELAAADMERAHQLMLSRATAQAEFDVARATFKTAEASIKVSEAAILQTKAALQEAKINLGYTTIRSPVKGIIVTRRVNIGQTLVSSLSAQSLFLIAKDLKRVQVWASVNEADLGSIKDGQKVTFTVDAYPGRAFVGAVSQIRLNATMTSNVVTYTVVVTTDNSDLALITYLTANMLFEVVNKDNALVVPNASLRWRPPLGQVTPGEREWYAKFLKDAKTNQGGDKSKQDQQFVWVSDGNWVRPIRIKTGNSDGTFTEVIEGNLTDNADVIIREERNDNGQGGSSPFAPSIFQQKKKE